MEDPHPGSGFEHLRRPPVPGQGVVQGGEVAGEAEGPVLDLLVVWRTSAETSMYIRLSNPEKVNTTEEEQCG